MMITIALDGWMDAILHVIFATLAMIIVYPRWSEKFWNILGFSIIMELITDGAHLITKSITHNIFFFVELPLAILLVGYIYSNRKLENFSILMLATNLTHMTMDLFWEGDKMQIYYPISSTWYSVPINYAGFMHGALVLLILLLPLAIGERGLWRKPTQPPTFPPYPI